MSRRWRTRFIGKDNPALRERSAGISEILEMLGCYEALPILNILVPHTGQIPWVAGRPFFIVMASVSFISRDDLHFTQYPSTVNLL